jgi:hypothetical protein
MLFSPCVFSVLDLPPPPPDPGGHPLGCSLLTIGGGGLDVDLIEGESDPGPFSLCLLAELGPKRLEATPMEPVTSGPT